MNGTRREDIDPGSEVNIVLKKDQRSGKLTHGFVKDILTSAPKHTHGIKVRLTSGEVGRVKEIIDTNPFG
ncbi:MAG: YwbE family protein [Roseivirga sp.]